MKNITTWDFRFLRLSKEVSTWSKDPSTQVGAIICRDNRVISLGFNGFPKSMPDKDEWLNNREEKYDRIVHAEINAILFAKEDLNGCTLYTWPMAPCKNCSTIIIQSGIKEVVSVTNNNPRWKDSIHKSIIMYTNSNVCWRFYNPEYLDY